MTSHMTACRRVAGEDLAADGRGHRGSDLAQGKGADVALFTSEYSFKVDRKGRVSVPADYRAALSGQSFQGIVVIPAMGEQALDGYANDRLEAMARAIDVPGTYDEEERDEAELLFAQARRLPFDGEGRVILPEECIKHAAIDEQVIYAGLGPSFRIWNPVAYTEHKARIAERARAKGRSLRLRPAPPTGGAR
jgi:MraZ protein